MNIEDIQAFCKTLPGTEESVKWENDLCFCIAEKMYAVVSLSGLDSLSFKAPTEQFEEFIATPYFDPAPYLGRYKWVHTKDFTQIPDADLRSYISQSYELIKSKLPPSKLKGLGNQ